MLRERRRRTSHKSLPLQLVYLSARKIEAAFQRANACRSYNTLDLVNYYLRLAAAKALSVRTLFFNSFYMIRAFKHPVLHRSVFLSRLAILSSTVAPPELFSPSWRGSEIDSHLLSFSVGV